MTVVGSPGRGFSLERVKLNADILHEAEPAVGAELCHAQFIFVFHLGAISELIIGGPGRLNTFAADKAENFGCIAILEWGDLKNLDGWNRINGTWVAEDGVLKQTSGTANTLITYGDLDWSDYTLTLKARKTGGAEGFLISFGVKDREQRRWNLGGWNNSSHAVEADDFGEEHLNGEIETDRWYDIKIELKGTTIKLYLDGKLLKTQQKLDVNNLAMDAGIDEAKGEVVLKFVNGNDKPTTYTVNSGKASVGEVKVLTLTGNNTNAENSYEAPENIAPKSSSITVDSGSFQYTFPAYSVNILRWKK